MKLYAISDLHIDFAENRQALEQLPSQPDDWLILAGDLADTLADFETCLDLLRDRFAQLIWTPGNHDLWTLPDDPHQSRGMARYEELVAICRRKGVLTPEDPYPVWKGAGSRAVLAPVFTLYDYSFRPDDVAEGAEIAWAMAAQIYGSDEVYLYHEPFASKRAWCATRCELTESRLAEIDPSLPIVLINHFPLLREHAVLPAIPQFCIWCGTRRTEAWHRQFNIRTVIYGHLHIRGVKLLDDVRFEEVSLGYPRHWEPARGLQYYLREILPGSRDE
jgi:3',5'-cyclic AMP phosphodiesterase CpdA